MSKLELVPLCASPEDLYDFYISNHKNLTKEDLEFEYDQHGVSFFKKLIEHFVGYYYPKTSCLIIREGLPFIRLYKSGKINSLLSEYLIDLEKVCNKKRKDFKIIVIPFEEENDIVPFINLISSIISLKINLWKGKKMLYDEVGY
jgi:hypothetical protein